MSRPFEWASTSGDAWAERWREIDRALSPVGAALHETVLEAAGADPFDAFDIGCGAGATSIALGAARADSRVLGCDLSPALVEIAKSRAAGLSSVHFEVGDAVSVAAARGRFDLFLSRHGVMFFPDPVEAFRTFRGSARDGAALVFSCFQGWDKNAWASELASAAAGKELPPPGREPSGFAFAEPSYVAGLLESAGWRAAEPQSLTFDYTASHGNSPVEEALSFLSEIGPASAVVRSMEPEHRLAAIERMRSVVERHRDGTAVSFPAAAWIWRAKAADRRSAAP